MSITIGSILPVGTIIHSMLSVAQFEGQYGDNWVLADGRSITGTLYASVTGLTTLPDMRGRFLRGKGANNPDGDLALGAYTADKFASHAHRFGGTGWSGHLPNIIPEIEFGGLQLSTLATTTSAGGNETAPKSITVNIFIRIN